VLTRSLASAASPDANDSVRSLAMRSTSSSDIGRNRPILSDGIEWGRIKSLTEGFSARDIETAADNAALAALKTVRGTDDIQPITQDHLEGAIQDIEPIESDYGTLP
jgi:SpoVK/Ycf46/Vps4 family AAA+-type ATPase